LRKWSSNYLNLNALGDWHKNRGAILGISLITNDLTPKKNKLFSQFHHFFLAISPKLVYHVGMNKIEKIEKLQKDIAFWQDKLNRSRKESLRSIRAVHLNHARNELKKLQESA